MSASVTEFVPGSAGACFRLPANVTPGCAKHTCVKLMQASSITGTATSTSLTARALQKLRMLTVQCWHECKCQNLSLDRLGLAFGCQHLTPGCAKHTCVKLMQASSITGTATSTSLTARALQKLRMLTVQCWHECKCQNLCLDRLGLAFGCQHLTPGCAKHTCVKLMQASSITGTATSTRLTARALQKLRMLTVQCWHECKCQNLCLDRLELAFGCQHLTPDVPSTPA